MRHLFLSACVVLGLCTSALAAPIDFETDTNGNPVTRLTTGALPDHTPFLVGDTYTTLGVVFSSDGDATGTDLGPVFGNQSGFTGSNTIVQDYKRDSGASFNVRADFSDVIDEVIVDVFSATGFTVTMTAYNEIGTALGSATSGALALGSGESVMLSGLGDISYLIWEASSPFSASVGIDNLDFKMSAVPLPAGGVLLLSGLVGFGWMRRRKVS